MFTVVTTAAKLRNANYIMIINTCTYMIDCIEFYAVPAIFQPCNGEMYIQLQVHNLATSAYIQEHN